MAIGKRSSSVKVLEPWIEAPPARVVFPVKYYKLPPMLETIHEEKEDKCEDQNKNGHGGCRTSYALMLSVLTCFFLFSFV